MTRLNLAEYYQTQVQNEATPTQLDALQGIPQKISISPTQGSRFAKEVAGDFNPLHDADSKRFCVPGDLLFTLTLARFGLTQKMQFRYQGMVGGNEILHFEEDHTHFRVLDNQQKCILRGEKAGDVLTDEILIQGFCQAYVAFSGMSFPDILVPLMREQNVMINPARPMVIYESMTFEFDRPVAKLQTIPGLRLEQPVLNVDGKRGKVTIPFVIEIDQREIGRGAKVMTLSGLKPFDHDAMDALIEAYQRAKQSWLCH